ncbi:class I SAM-dependent methyltransferase [Streptomyces sp. NPDC005962]|uniref:class I SAM-dependent methyltransferase n=1 Tax=Streptomyces sp. NPDC005962 TaxID=3154466 RepID=UPI0033FF94D6
MLDSARFCGELLLAKGCKEMCDSVISSVTDDAPRWSMRETFAHIYESRMLALGDSGTVGAEIDSRSGTGSNLTQTAALRAELPALVADLEVRSFLDVPCGDLFWMSRVDLGIDTYIGADIVPAVIDRNRERFARSNREFQGIDLTRDRLPQVDLVFSRDCLVHFGDEDVRRALANIKGSGSTYLAMTTFPDHPENGADIETGAWRPLNFELAPFLLPKPFRLINEQCTEVDVITENGAEVEHRYSDKSIGVWRIAEL